MWLYLALFSALIYSLRSVIEKVSLEKIDKYILAFGLRLFALPFFILPFIFNPKLLIPLNTIPTGSWIAILFVSIISSPVEILFFYKALKVSEVTKLVPLLSIAPIFTTIFSSIIFRTIPSLFGIIGVIIIIFSVYVLNISKANRGLLEPFRHLSHDKSSHYVFIMMVSYALGVVIDKLALAGINAYFYALINYALVSVSLGIIAAYKSRSLFGQIKTNFWTFILLGTIVFSYTIPRNLAIQAGNAGYVSAVLSTSVIISTLIGLIWLKEKDQKVKILASVIAFVGILILKLYS